MSFLDPERLWLLVGVVALVVLYLVLQARRRTYAVRFTNLELLSTVAPSHPGWRRHLTALGFVAGLTSLVLAFARPAQADEVPRERATIVVAIDVSLSMQATDVSPDRLTAARAAAQDFVEALPDTLNVGLVGFAGTATLEVPPTDDHAAVNAAIDALELDEATAIGDAILASLAAIDLAPPDQEGTPPPAAIVLLSDGETSVGTPNEVAAQEARAAGVPVSTIAFGTDDATVEIPGQGTVPVPVNGAALRDVATSTGGHYFEAASAPELEAVYADIGTAVGYEEEEREITAWFVGLGLLLLTATAGGSLLWFSRLP